MIHFPFGFRSYIERNGILIYMNRGKKETYSSGSALVWHFLRGSRKWFAGAILFATLVSLLDLVNPKIIGYTVDTVLGTTKTALPGFLQNFIDGLGGTAYLKANLWTVAIAVLLVALAGALCRFLFKLFNSIGAEKFVKTMRDELFEHILHLPFTWHSENHTGDIIQRCTSDVDQIKMFLSEQLTSLFRVIVLIILAMFFMFRMNVKLALASAVFIPIIVAYSYFFHSRIGKQFRIVDEKEGELSSVVQENLTGIRVVRAFGRESYEKSRFETSNDTYTNMWIRLLRLMAAFWSSSDLFSYAQILTVIAYGAYLCVNGDLTAGSYIAFITYSNMLMWPIRMLGRVISNLSRVGISVDRIMYIMNTEEEKDVPDAVEPDMDKDIVFDHVSYQYSNGTQDILNDVSFTVKKGTTVGILGGTGSGKSTLMYLLDRLYDLPEEDGKITIGGVDIRRIKREWIRKNIGMVLQEPYLFSRTLEENIRIARPTAEHQDVMRATHIAALDESIDHFNEGYDTFVGERGVTLSGGQKQRTAIAQMLIRKPEIMVFDDSLSAVDAETDAKIRAELKENVSESTVILIAHRITTLMNADLIIVMDQGRVVEEGNHEQLLAKNGIYRRIYDLQSQQSSVGEEAAA